MAKGLRLSGARVLAALAIALLPGFARSADTQPATTQSAGNAGVELLHVVDEQAPRPFDPTDAYEMNTIEGWVVRVNKRMIAEQPELARKSLELLKFQLYQITRVVPAPALEKIRTVPIWVEQDDALVICMCYHPDRDWVVSHGLNPEKAHCVEIGNARRFLEWEKTQPWMVLHELAHAYHHLFLPDGFENTDVQAAFDSAKEQKLYDHVLRENGRTEKAYAMTNAMEYFAECSEAFFGTNDFYPFVRAEFEKYDPTGYEVLSRAWGVDPPKRDGKPSASTTPGTGSK